jgi:hypothetical protein
MNNQINQNINTNQNHTFFYTPNNLNNLNMYSLLINSNFTTSSMPLTSPIQITMDPLNNNFTTSSTPSTYNHQVEGYINDLTNWNNDNEIPPLVSLANNTIPVPSPSPIQIHNNGMTGSNVTVTGPGQIHNNGMTGSNVTVTGPVPTPAPPFPLPGQILGLTGTYMNNGNQIFGTGPIPTPIPYPGAIGAQNYLNHGMSGMTGTSTSSNKKIKLSIKNEKFIFESIPENYCQDNDCQVYNFSYKGIVIKTKLVYNLMTYEVKPNTKFMKIINELQKIIESDNDFDIRSICRTIITKDYFIVSKLNKKIQITI